MKSIDVKFAAYAWSPIDDCNPMVVHGYTDKEAKEISSKARRNVIWSVKDVVNNQDGYRDTDAYVDFYEIYAAEINGRKIDPNNVSAKDIAILARYYSNLAHNARLEKQAESDEREAPYLSMKDKLEKAKVRLHYAKYGTNGVVLSAPMTEYEKDLRYGKDRQGDIDVFAGGKVIPFNIDDKRNYLSFSSDGITVGRLSPCSNGSFTFATGETVGEIDMSQVKNVSFNLQKSDGYVGVSCFADFEYQDKKLSVCVYNPSNSSYIGRGENLEYRGKDYQSEECKNVILACGRLDFEKAMKKSMNRQQNENMIKLADMHTNDL